GLDRVGPSDDKPLLSWNEHLSDDGNAGLVLCPLDAIGLIVGDSSSAASDKNSSDLYRFLRAENKRASLFESTRLLYVAATRAKSKLLLLANMAKNDKDELKAPTANALLARLWNTLADEAVLLSTPVSRNDKPLSGDSDSAHNEDIDQPAYPLLKRLSLAAINSSSAIDTDQLTDLDSTDVAVLEKEESLPAKAPSIIGTCVHEIFEQMAQPDFKSWSDDDIQLQQAIWSCRLLQLGIHYDVLDEALETVTMAIKSVLNSTIGQWVFSTSYRSANNEWALSYLSKESDAPLYRYVIDRSFIDNNVRWIIDYK
ncbi:MAG: hypothetical protein ACPG3T_07925, partial [Pseudomonadales bacterium]